MSDEIKKIERSAKEEIPKAKTLETLEELRIQFLGRERGALTLILRGLKNLPPKERAKTGEAANYLRQKIETLFEKRNAELKRDVSESVLIKEQLDVTRPGIHQPKGHLHPYTKVLREITRIFESMGFGVVEGPEVETEYYNFDALNIPANHPARNLWDTFWLKQSRKAELFARSDLPRKSDLGLSGSRLLLRTHTSPVQVRFMEKHNPPFRIIAPGRVFRYEATDASHEFQFYQIEGLMVDKDVSIANFKAVIEEFFSRLFATRVKTRLRPSYFPFVEPGFEVDISCVVCGQKGCSACKKMGWLEIAGAGMVHPNVFKAVGYNPKNVRGFAFGMGLDRIVMMKYKIPDIRLFHSGDLRFLKQF
ncbi:MAG: phenylalanine--tRNA ligase subunit alpha [bacterium]|nr:phenylalanine--tRNA ligase subunit alpha [bacterium]